MSIKETAWKTRPITDEQLVATVGIKVLDLSKLSVEKGSLILSLEGTTTDNGGGGTIPDDDVENPFQKEVDFIDGVSELGGEIVQTTETIPKGLVSSMEPSF